MPHPSASDTQATLYRPDILEVIEKSIGDLDDRLRALSLDIHAHPELGFQEIHAHDVLTEFMLTQGFNVERQHLLPTAWLATFTHGKGGRTIGVNSEMDALKGIGHACGHNLIAIAGVAVACALKDAMEKFDIAGTVKLLGTPAEEGGSGKVILLEKGAYQGMDVCLMSHPGPGPKGAVAFGSCLAIQQVEVEYFGHTAHAALSPWEGINALDAAVLGYNNISALRQQLKPTCRVHGVFEGHNWSANVIPDYAKYLCYIRALSRAEKDLLIKRVLPCFEAAALATGCKVKIRDVEATHDDCRQNKVLARDVASVIVNRFAGPVDYDTIIPASTDFGNVTYEMPSLHVWYAVPTEKNGGNHTPAFTKSAATIEAHHACLTASKAVAATGVRVLLDDVFFAEVKEAFEQDKLIRGPDV